MRSQRAHVLYIHTYTYIHIIIIMHIMYKTCLCKRPLGMHDCIFYLLLYINKEELKTVGRDILACAQPNRHETFTAHWSPYRRVSSRGRRAQICFGRGARGEKPENNRPPFWFYGESIRTSVHGSHIVLLWKRHHRNAIVGTNMKYLCM